MGEGHARAIRRDYAAGLAAPHTPSSGGSRIQIVLACVRFPPLEAQVWRTAMASGLQALPQTFTYTEARRQGLSDRALYALRGRGLYRRADSGEAADIDLLEIAHRAPEATICLTSALARHGLTDQIPAVIDIAVPRGRRRPRTQAPVAWHTFTPATFGIGRDELRLDAQTSIG